MFAAILLFGTGKKNLTLAFQFLVICSFSVSGTDIKSLIDAVGRGAKLLYSLSFLFPGTLRRPEVSASAICIEWMLQLLHVPKLKNYFRKAPQVR